MTMPPKVESKEKEAAKQPGLKDKNLQAAVAAIEKQYGAGAIMRLGDETAKLDIPVISTGALSLDLALGVNLDDLLISQPDSGEEALTITETLIRSNAVDVIVVDSVAALVPRAELEGRSEERRVG